MTWNCNGGLPLLETGGGVAMFEGARSGSWGGTTMARAWNGTRGTCFDVERIKKNVAIRTNIQDVNATYK